MAEQIYPAARQSPAHSAVPCLAVLMPVYNESGTIAEIVRAVLHEPIVAQLIVVDDGSTDATPAILKDLASDSRVVLLRHDVNRGKGAALRTGFPRVAAPFVVIQDADLEYEPREYTKLIAPMMDGRADVVFGSRFLGSEAHRVLYFWHSVGNRFLTLLSNAATDLNLSDMETGYKAFRREVLDRIELKENGFGIEPELTAKVARLGVRIYEVAVSYHGRTYAEGKKITWRDGMHALLCIFKYNFLAR
jgi:glycosyltransferase involved in cell wall biosynthesis